MRRARVILWAVVAIAAVAAVAVFAVARLDDDETRRSVPVRPNSLAFLDGDGRAVAGVPLGGRPIRLTFGNGMFWAPLPERGAVVGVDADTRAVRRLRVGVTPYDVAFGEGALWVVDHDAQKLFRVDPETGAVRASPSLRQPAVAVGYGLGSVWVVVASGALLRFDPETLAVTRTFDAIAVTGENAEPKLAFAGDSVWVSSPLADSSVRVEPGPGIVFRRPIPGATGATASDDAVWVGDALGSLRTVSGEPRRIPLGVPPVDAAADDDAVWAVSYDDRAVVRVDLGDDAVDARAPLPHPPVAVAVGDDAVAVAVQRRAPG